MDLPGTKRNKNNFSAPPIRPPGARPGSKFPAYNRRPSHVNVRFARRQEISWLSLHPRICKRHPRFAKPRAPRRGRPRNCSTGRPGPFQAARTAASPFTLEQKGVAMITRIFQIRHMAEMQDVEAAVGHDELFACRAKFLSPRRQIVPRNDFSAEIHPLILPASPVNSTFSHTRSVSVTPHACASQPRWECGASPSRISGNWPRQPSSNNLSAL